MNKTLPTSEQVHAITLIGGEWFDRVNGNSYNRCKIYLNGELVHVTLFQYGYGDYYLQAAQEWLQKNIFTDMGENEPLWRYCRDKRGMEYITHKQTNMLKRDLMNW